MILLRRKAHFSAAHRLHNPRKSEQWNEQMYGECGGENWHGHNYKLEVSVAGTPDPETGYIIDLFVLKDIIHKQIVQKCDHKNLNMDVDFLEGIIPSTENMVKIFLKNLKSRLLMRVLHPLFIFCGIRRNRTKFCCLLSLSF